MARPRDASSEKSFGASVVSSRGCEAVEEGVRSAGVGDLGRVEVGVKKGAGVKEGADWRRGGVKERCRGSGPERRRGLGERRRGGLRDLLPPKVRVRERDLERARSLRGGGERDLGGLRDGGERDLDLGRCE